MNVKTLQHWVVYDYRLLSLPFTAFGLHYIVILLGIWYDVRRVRVKGATLKFNENEFLQKTLSSRFVKELA